MNLPCLRKRFLSLAALLCLFSSTAFSAEPADTQAVVDAQVSTQLSTLEAEQTAYFTANGGANYLQLLNSNTTVPTMDVAPNNLDAQPPSMSKNWRDIGLDESIDMRYRCKTTVYNGSMGKGWVLTIETQIGSQKYKRVVNYGPETNRNMAWTAF